MRKTVQAGARGRDSALSERILAAARDLLAEHGYQGLSIDAVARAAGTTRPSVYLRFRNKEDLATSAVAGMQVDEPRPVTDDIRADLVAELRHFQVSVTRPHGMSLVGTVLAEEHLTPGLIARFRERLALPRRHRFGRVLERGIRTGALRSELDVEAVTGMLVGSLYAHHLAFGNVPPDWPERVVDALWPAVCGPSARSGSAADPARGPVPARPESRSG
ncbi:MAG TPA: TetR/AcrR family transcriptional regulator [Pseudonocardia sp.]|jgi:AcrR family transcriptional regulator